MQSVKFHGAWVRAEGIVQRVDRLTREVGVQVGGRVLVFDVPPDCTVLMNGQPVRLRLLLSRDRVEVDYSQGSDQLVAHCIRVIGVPSAQGGQSPGDPPGPSPPEA
jgi:hypothetical protein